MNIWSLFRAARRSPGKKGRWRRSHRINPTCESLEDRQLLSADAAAGSLTQVTAKPSLEVLPLASTGPTGLTPQQILSAYGINPITFSSGTSTGTPCWWRSGEGASPIR